MGESSLRPKRNWRPWKRRGRLLEGNEISEGELDVEGKRLLAEREEPLLQRILCLRRGMFATEMEL